MSCYIFAMADLNVTYIIKNQENHSSGCYSAPLVWKDLSFWPSVIIIILISLIITILTTLARSYRAGCCVLIINNSIYSWEWEKCLVNRATPLSSTQAKYWCYKLQWALRLTKLCPPKTEELWWKKIYPWLVPILQWKWKFLWI